MPITAEPQGPALEAFLLGTIDFELGLALQERLAYEISGRNDGRVALLLCEHPLGITIGRQGSWSHVEIDEHERLATQMEVRFVARGGGCLLHAPGQLAVYPIVPLDWHGFSIGEYLDRLQSALTATLSKFITPQPMPPGRYGVWGRSGQLASVGVAVRRWTALHGAFINVDPPNRWFRRIQSDPAGGTRLSSLLAEKGRPVKMSAVRAQIVDRLAPALGCERYHVYTGHPLIKEVQARRADPASRVG